MSPRLKTALEQMKHDLVHLFPGLLAAAAFILAMEYFFGAVCISRVLAGLPCPGCGLTRATMLFFQGDFIGSFLLHPLLILLPAGAFLGLYERYFSTRSRHYFTLYLIVTVILFLLLYLIRMKLYYPRLQPVQYDPHNLLHWLRTHIKG